MADKSPAESIAEKEAEIAKLKAEQEKLEIKAAPQYPKQIRIESKEHDPASLKDADGKFYQVIEVNSEEDEKNAKKKVPVPAASVTGHVEEDEDEKKHKGGKR